MGRIELRTGFEDGGVFVAWKDVFASENQVSAWLFRRLLEAFDSLANGS